jgi:AcrR family transcriptional regulator
MTEMKERILEAAHGILSNEGPAALTTRHVCEAVGVTMPTLYHYFPSRDELAKAVHGLAFRRFTTRKRSLKLTDHPLADLRISCEVVLDFVSKNKNATVAVMARGLEEPAMLAQGYELLRDRVHRAAAAGSLRVAEQEATAMTWSVVQGLVVLMIASPDPANNLGAVRRRVLDSLFAAL